MMHLAFHEDEARRFSHAAFNVSAMFRVVAARPDLPRFDGSGRELDIQTDVLLPGHVEDAVVSGFCCTFWTKELLSFPAKVRKRPLTRLYASLRREESAPVSSLRGPGELDIVNRCLHLQLCSVSFVFVAAVLEVRTRRLGRDYGAC
jgi:hypothetical protein